MLTYEEVQLNLKEAMKMDAEEFVKLTADHFPQDVIPKLTEEWVEFYMDRVREYESLYDVVVALSVASMVGFQLGWMVREAAMK